MDNKNDFDRDYTKHIYGLDDIDLSSDVDGEGGEQPEPRVPKNVSSAKMEMYDWVQCIVAAIIAGILIFVFVGRVIGVDGMSMYSTLHHGDKLVTSNLFFTPEYGDIIVFKTEYYGDEPLVKRVIATEGQTVDIDFNAGIVYVDGVALDEDYTYTATVDPEDFSEAVTVPDGCVFVLGDNRGDSSDSRCDRVGFVDTRDILGKAHLIIIPGADSVTGRRIWSRVGSVYK